MKKFGTLALAAMLVTALSVSASAVSTFEAATGTPTVDGKKDDAYACAAIAVKYLENGSGVSDKAAVATAYTAWDKDFLYVFVDVVDSKVTPKDKVTSIWANDSIEFYINLSGKDGKTAEINAAQYTYGPSYTKFAGGGLHKTNNEANAKSAYTYTDKGWTVEVAIPWGADYTPKADALVPFALGLNDNAEDDPGTRTYHLFTGEKDQGNLWSAIVTANMDSLKLTTKKYEAPKKETTTTAAATADMGIVAALAALATSGAAVLSLKKRK